MPSQQLAGITTQRDIAFTHLDRERPDERVGEEQHIVVPFPERGQMHVKHAQPVEEVTAEPPGGHVGRQIAVRRGDQADIGLQRCCPTEPLELSLLQHTEELDLHGGGEFADLVEKERSVGRQFKAPGLLTVRTGEGAPLVAKELRLQEGVGQCRAVDRDEGPVGPGTGVVNRTGDQFLPRPALSSEQHGRFRARHLSRPGERLAQQR